MNENVPGLPLESYRDNIHLDEPFITDVEVELTESAYSASIEYVLNELLQEHPEAGEWEIPTDTGSKRALVRSMLVVRMPDPLPAAVLTSIDIILEFEKHQRDIAEGGALPNVRLQFDTDAFPEELVLWQGDITTLKTDAIVNAANSQLLGCFQPSHVCIDNVIHAKAGPRLREDCEVIMDLQGHLEPTGSAKITRGYHLPSKYILHTVGPIVPDGTPVTITQRNQLHSCYTSCLSLAAEVPSVRSVAFCGISTGLFGYPKDQAATVAIQAVCEWLMRNPGRMDRVLFNVFANEDWDAYARIFRSVG